MGRNLDLGVESGFNQAIWCSKTSTMTHTWLKSAMVNISVPLLTYMPSRAIIWVTTPSMGASTGIRFRVSLERSISR